MQTLCKACAACGQEFVPRKYSSGRQKYCTPDCARQRKAEQKQAQFQVHYAANREARITNARRWALANPEKMREHQRRSMLKRKYSMTLEDYDAMLANQGGVCAICGTTDTAPWDHFAVDHCHQSGNVRGLLCQGCNTCIGRVDDNTETLRKAIRYLENHRLRGVA